MYSYACDKPQRAKDTVHQSVVLCCLCLPQSLRVLCPRVMYIQPTSLLELTGSSLWYAVLFLMRSMNARLAKRLAWYHGFAIVYAHNVHGIVHSIALHYRPAT